MLVFFWGVGKFYLVNFLFFFVFFFVVGKGEGLVFGVGITVLFFLVKEADFNRMCGLIFLLLLSFSLSVSLSLSLFFQEPWFSEKMDEHGGPQRRVACLRHSDSPLTLDSFGISRQFVPMPGLMASLCLN